MITLVHIGYPKCGSTWLQSEIFNGSDPNIRPLFPSYVNEYGYFKSGGDIFYSPPVPVLGKTMSKYAYTGLFDVDLAKQQIVERSEPGAKITVLSNEAWVGHPFSGGVQYGEYAQRIKDTVPDAKILITVRAQERMILSAYAHFIVQAGGRCSLRQFLTSTAHNQIPWPSPHFYCYHYLIERYVSLFGRENVLVVPFELLTQRGVADFLAPIYDFLGLPGPDRSLRPDAKNARDYRRYVLLSRLRFLNLIAAPMPANGNTGWSAFRLLNSIAAMGASALSRQFVETAVVKDLDLIREYFAPFASETNSALQGYVEANLSEMGYSGLETASEPKQSVSVQAA